MSEMRVSTLTGKSRFFVALRSGVRPPEDVVDSPSEIDAMQI